MFGPKLDHEQCSTRLCWCSGRHSSMAAAWGTEGKSSAGGFLLLWEDNLSVWRLERGGSALWGTELKTEVLSASTCSIFAPGPSTAPVYSLCLNFLALLPHSQILHFFFFSFYFSPSLSCPMSHSSVLPRLVKGNFFSGEHQQVQQRG